MYTSSGNDKVYQKGYSENVYIADFDEKDDRLIFIDNMPLRRANPVWKSDNQWFNNNGADAIPLDFYYGQVVLESFGSESFDMSDVKGWVSIAEIDVEDKNSSYTDPDTGKVYVGAELERFVNDNPIKIQ